MSDFYKIIQKINKENDNIGFDRVMMELLGYDGKDAGFTDDIRKKAFHDFRSKTGRRDFASLPTMRRWFGLDGKSVPDRMCVYQICFALGFGRKELDRLLTEGLSEQGANVNDYFEIAFMYGLENGIDYDEATQIAMLFEDGIEVGQSFNKTHSTSELIEQFEQAKTLGKDEFLFWMQERTDWFRGYSKTVMKYFDLLKKQIIGYIREEIKPELELALSEAGYYSWFEKNGISDKNSIEEIRRFIKNASRRKKDSLSEEMKDNIHEMAKIYYNDEGSNSIVLAEVYPKSGLESTELPYMSAKRFSDILNIPAHKESRMRLEKARRELELSEENECPEWIETYMEELGMKKPENSHEAADIITEYLKENARRFINVQREDFLPLILNVSQRKIEKEKNWNYNKKEAVSEFVEMADGIFGACYMEPINEKKKPDIYFMACFQEDEMYSYGELVECMVEMLKK